jgi:ubiquitin-conjugating enzyme E2 H
VSGLRLFEGADADKVSWAEYVQRYANRDAADEAGAESEDEDDMSSVASFGDEDEEPAGQMDDI